MTLPRPRFIIWDEIYRLRDKQVFDMLLWTGPLTRRLDRIAALLNKPPSA